jgi:hypothetical protein
VEPGQSQRSSNEWEQSSSTAIRSPAQPRSPGASQRDSRGQAAAGSAIFHPTGLLGTAYWYGLFAVHS